MTLDEAIRLADDPEIEEDCEVLLALSDLRLLLSTFRKVGARVTAMKNGAEQVAKCAADFSKWCADLEPK